MTEIKAGNKVIVYGVVENEQPPGNTFYCDGWAAEVIEVRDNWLRIGFMDFVEGIYPVHRKQCRKIHKLVICPQCNGDASETWPFSIEGECNTCGGRGKVREGTKRWVLP